MTSSTALTLFDAHAVLETLFRSSDDVAKCAVCDTKLVSTSFYICRYPDSVNDAFREYGASGIQKDKDRSEGYDARRHRGHTACKSCVDEWKYIGEAGSCIACVRALGNCRSVIKYAGVALRPAIENYVLNKVLDNLRVAEREVDVARERGENARIKEGTDRRLAAVEAKRRKRASMVREAEEEAKRAADEIMKAAERQVCLMRKRAEREIRGRQSQAEEIANHMIEEAQRGARCIASPPLAHMSCHVLNESESGIMYRCGSALIPKATTASNTTPNEFESGKQCDEDSYDSFVLPRPQHKKRRPLAIEVIEKRRATLAAKAHKVATYDAVSHERDRAVHTLEHVVHISKLWIERLGGDVDVFTRYVDMSISQLSTE